MVDAAKKAAGQARDTPGKLTHDNRYRIDAALDKAGAAVDQRTGRKYAKHIESVKRQLGRGVDVVAGQAPAAGTGSAAPAGAPTPAPATTPPASAASQAPATAAPGSTTPSTTPGSGQPPVTPPCQAQEGWHRGPNSERVRSDS